MFECHITNGTSPLGLSIRYFGYSLLEKPDRVAIPGFVKRSETLDKDMAHFYLPFGDSKFMTYSFLLYKWLVVKISFIVNSLRQIKCLRKNLIKKASR